MSCTRATGQRCPLIRDVLPGRREPLPPRWLTAPVRELARAAYDGHRFNALPALADALGESGGTHGALLRHRLKPGLRARGCWALDRVLGPGEVVAPNLTLQQTAASSVVRDV